MALLRGRRRGLAHQSPAAFFVNEDFLVSLVVSTYNRPDALSAVLDGCAAQTDRRFEVIVADDGSTDSTRTAIEQSAKRLPVPLEHVWHPDDGFRAAAIRNKGIARARGDYIVFLDGDCIPQADFVARHRALAAAGSLVTGSRILLGRALTAEVLEQRVELANCGAGFWLRARMRGQVNKIMPLFVKLPDLAARRVEGFRWRGIKSCNLAVWASDLATVNGFDESFVGWGHEDADLVARLHNAGVARKHGFMSTEVLHLWHPEQPRDREGGNRERVVQRLADRRVEAQIGLAQLRGQAADRPAAGTGSPSQRG
jgi:glycosyltransferase involved in cell wall biosynthesis